MGIVWQFSAWYFLFNPKSITNFKSCLTPFFLFRYVPHLLLLTYLSYLLFAWHFLKNFSPEINFNHLLLMRKSKILPDTFNSNSQIQVWHHFFSTPLFSYLPNIFAWHFSFIQILPDTKFFFVLFLFCFHPVALLLHFRWRVILFKSFYFSTPADSL